jgi:hypothetical protein
MVVVRFAVWMASWRLFLCCWIFHSRHDDCHRVAGRGLAGVVGGTGLFSFRWRCGLRRGRRRGRRVVVRREGVQSEFIALGGVGGIDGREFQVSSVLDGQDVFLKVGGVGVLHRGRLFGVALAGLLGLGAGGKGSAHGGKGRGLGSRPEKNGGGGSWPAGG